MNDRVFSLPESVLGLVEARNALRARYSSSALKFTFDGNLVGDLGEAIAAELFGLTLDQRSSEGTDGIARNGWTVQVKATGTGRGPAFRKTNLTAKHLLFFMLDFENRIGKVVYNGPEEPVRSILLAYSNWTGQRQVSLRQMSLLDSLVTPEERLERIA
jgi:hypothetical protein